MWHKIKKNFAKILKFALMYAEIILPLPIYGTFTYEIPEDKLPLVQAGVRVLVQFGNKKYYTGIVQRTHMLHPGYALKPILEVMDDRPIVRYPQLKLWDWISEYYLCTTGDVMKAALPTGLKPESETFVTLNEDFDMPDGVKLTDRQAMVVMLLEEKKKLRVSDIERELKLKNAAHVVSGLLEAGVVNVDEKVVEKYCAKRETHIILNLERGDEEGLHRMFDLVTRSRMQEKTLIAWLELSSWLHRCTPLKAVTREMLTEASGVTPGVLKAMVDKGIFRREKRSVNRFNIKVETEISPSPLSEAQRKAYDEIREAFRSKDVALLHGVTGSGKTEIYTHLIKNALMDGNQVLYLVPEISLTTQLTDRLRKVLGDRLLVYHSKFSDSERVDIWRKLLGSTEPLVVLGARSAVLLPFAHLGLIIVDEEHESSYKQYEPAPRYNARDTSIVLATMHGAKTLLGSATPSIETYYKGKTGKYGLVTLSERYDGSVLPDVEIVDMREQRKKKLNTGMFSSPMVSALRHTLADKKQAILFQNRRGFAPVVVCRQCGWTPKCENCDVSPVYHKNVNLLKCHYCGATAMLPSLCPACGQNSIDIFGYGTERIAEETQSLMPEAKVSRMDLDTTRNKDSYQHIIEEFSNHDTDILVGTQMVTKGLDFDDVKMSGVINADTLLNFPDFRSNERAYNMLEQVAGRAGRRKDKGLVLIQTTDPKNPVLDFVRRHEYADYYAYEIKERQEYHYPPFTRIINVYLRNKDSATCDRASVLFAKRLREVFGNRVLGPEKPFVSRVSLWYIQGIILKVEAGASMKKVKDLLRGIFEELAPHPDMKSTQIHYDVDPA